ncbi:AbrB/MazE/SpoVT family DNA-binding domain-containing protein [Desulfobacterales bacterium HSG2]|nr:AbrB/MazE/SpoVT family DNA-binding domain-containing protein [Desulfobacterales bacterium HSG2]
MLITSISDKGQVIIPEHIRQIKNWKTGQELLLTEIDDGILLKSVSPFKPTTLNEVARCLPYHGTAKGSPVTKDGIHDRAAKPCHSGRNDRSRFIPDLG